MAPHGGVCLVILASSALLLAFVEIATSRGRPFGLLQEEDFGYPSRFQLVEGVRGRGRGQEREGGVPRRGQMLFEHHEMPFPALGGGGGLGGADGVGGSGDQNVMYGGEPRSQIEKKFGMRLPDARGGRRTGWRLAEGSQMLHARYERRPDEGVDYYSAIQAPDKWNSQPWLRDAKFRDGVVSGMQGAGGGSYEETGGAHVYERNPYDEYGMAAYEPDMSVVDDCYNSDTPDCYRAVFDPETGYPRY